MSDPLIRALLEKELAGDMELVRAAEGIVAYTQFLLEDDENLTRVGNLTGVAKARLRTRVLELIGADPGEPPRSDDDDEGLS